jgi:hypothetical protein
MTTARQSAPPSRQAHERPGASATLPAHGELVKRAVRWLLNRGGCSIAFSEFTTAANETPDVIGFKGRISVVIECKTSASDFYRDKKKVVRRMSCLAMGAERYYMVPAGMLRTDQIPNKWGLLWAAGRHVKVIRKSQGFVDRDRNSEIGFLTSMLRRIKIGIQTEDGIGDRLNQWIKTLDHRSLP